MINIVPDPASNMLEINGSLINKFHIGEVIIQGDLFSIIKSNGAYWAKNVNWDNFTNDGTPFTSADELKTFLKENLSPNL